MRIDLTTKFDVGDTVSVRRAGHGGPRYGTGRVVHLSAHVYDPGQHPPTLVVLYDVQVGKHQWHVSEDDLSAP